MDDPEWRRYRARAAPRGRDRTDPPGLASAAPLVAPGEHGWRASFCSWPRWLCWAGLPPPPGSSATYLDRDARFRIAGASNIEATGLTEVSRAEMLPVFGEDIGRNIFFVPLNERRRQLEEIPWVERATVMRLLPGPDSRLGRRAPAGGLCAPGCGRSAWWTRTGFCSPCPPAMMAQHHYSFPVVTGIDAA